MRNENHNLRIVAGLNRIVDVTSTIGYDAQRHGSNLPTVVLVGFLIRQEPQTIVRIAETTISLIETIGGKALPLRSKVHPPRFATSPIGFETYPIGFNTPDWEWDAPDWE